MNSILRSFRPAALGIFLAAAPALVSAQDSLKRLSMEDAVATAMAGNKELQLAAIDERIAAAGLKQTEAAFLPQLGFSYTAATTNNPLNAFGFKLQEQSIGASDFNPATLNNPGGRGDFMTRLELQQPIVNMDQYYLRKGAARQVEVFRFKTRRTREWLEFRTRQAWLQLQLAYESRRVLADALQTAEAVSHWTEDRVGQGFLHKSDLLNARVQVNTIESGLAMAVSDIKNGSDYLSLLMGSPYGVVYLVDEPLSQFDGQVYTDSTVPAGRADFAALQKQLETADLGIRSGKMSRLPKLNAFGSYQLNDDRIFGFGANAYLAGIRLSVDIFRGNSTRNKIFTQVLERSKLAEQLSLQRQESQLELNKERRKLADAGYKIRQQIAAVEASAESLRILRDRYEQGLENSTEVLQAQTRMIQQEQARAQALFEYQLALAYIKFLTTK